MLEDMARTRSVELDIRASLGELSEKRRADIIPLLEADFDEIVPTPVPDMIARRSSRDNLLVFATPSQVSVVKHGTSGKPLEQGFELANRIMEKCLVETVDAVSLDWTGEAKGARPALDAYREMLSKQCTDSVLFEGVEAVGYHLFLRFDEWLGDLRVEPLANDKSLHFLSLTLNRAKRVPRGEALMGLAEAQAKAEGHLRTLLAGLGVTA